MYYAELRQKGNTVFPISTKIAILPHKEKKQLKQGYTNYSFYIALIGPALILNEFTDNRSVSCCE
jgi:hypothetical protein